LTRPEAQSALADLRRSVDSFRQGSNAVLDSDPRPDLANRYRLDVVPSQRLALLDCSHIREDLATFTHEVAAAARDEARRATWLVSVVSLLALMLSSLAAIRFGRAVIWPIRDLTDSVEAVRRGDFRRKVPLRSDDELGRLSDGFNRMVEALAEHQRSIRVELVAVASHELKTPITTMRMTLSLLSEAADQFSSKQREMLETAMLGCEQLSATVDAFLDLTRIEAGELQLSVDQVDLGRLVTDATRVFGSRCDEAGIVLRCAIAPDVPSISGDPVRLRMVLSNILSNSLKYTPSGGEIAVEVGRSAWERPSLPSRRGSSPPSNPPRDAVRIVVSDTGPGIPPEYRELVFEKFFRVEHMKPPPDGHSAGGSGIGLYLSRRVIEAHGGEINCDAPQTGRGTRMTIALPA
jgi:signal transduction histidine kinase